MEKLVKNKDTPITRKIRIVLAISDLFLRSPIYSRIMVPPVLAP